MRADRTSRKLVIQPSGRPPSGIGDFWSDIQNNLLPTLLPAVVGSGLLETLFRTMFPEGAPINFEIPRYTSTVPGLGIDITVCPEGGCGGQLTVRRVEIRPVSPAPSASVSQFQVSLMVSIDSRNASGQRAALPIHIVGDALVDIDTSRGVRNELAFTAPLYVSLDANAPMPSANLTQIRPEFLSLPISVWIGTIAALPGFEVEEDDLLLTGNGLTGRLLTSGVNLFKQKLVELIRSELEYSLNRQVCTRFGVQCPTQFDLRPVETPSFSSTVTSIVTPEKVAMAAGGLILLWAIFK